MDTALFVMLAGDTEEDSTLLCFTSTKDKEVGFAFFKVINLIFFN